MYSQIIIKSKVYKSHTEKGFTLVELMVSIAVFLVIMTISLGSIISILDAGRKARSLKQVMTNLNFAAEVISREVKFGRNYHCGVDTDIPRTKSDSCPSGGGTAITFTTSEGVETIYRLRGTQIEKSIDSGVSYIGVTSPDVTVEGLTFYVIGTSPIPNRSQPRVLMIVRGFAGVKPTVQSRFTLQTVMSQRSLNL
jgi:prepilin-type N-terminal cleavage/methylation domain-containing protein